MVFSTLTTNAQKKQLFLKKNVVVKFVPVNGKVKNGLESRNDTETTTIYTVPTTSGVYTLPF